MSIRIAFWISIQFIEDSLRRRSNKRTMEMIQNTKFGTLQNKSEIISKNISTKNS